MLRQRRRQVVEHEEDVAAEQVVHGGRRAAVGHMVELDAGHGLEQGGRQVRGGADALRAVGNAAGIGLGLLDQLLHRRHAELGADDQHVGRAAEDRDRLEPGRVVVELLVERLVDRQRGRRRGQQRVAVGRSAREGLGAHIAGRSGPVLDDTGCFQTLLSASPTMRGRASAVPPAGLGTMILTVEDGKLWAAAGPQAANSESPATTAVNSRRTGFDCIT